MVKKYLRFCLILTILNLTNCSSLEVINKENIVNGEEELDTADDLYIITKDFSKYYFPAYTYQVLSDSIYGNGTLERDSLVSQFRGSVAMKNIVSFEQNRTNTGNTIILLASIISTSLIILVIIGASSIDDSLK